MPTVKINAKSGATDSLRALDAVELRKCTEHYHEIREQQTDGFCLDNAGTISTNHIAPEAREKLLRLIGIGEVPQE
jgi:hypothetical protein